MAVVLVVDPRPMQEWFHQQEMEGRAFVVYVGTTDRRALSFCKMAAPGVVILGSGPAGPSAVH